MSSITELRHAVAHLQTRLTEANDTMERLRAVLLRTRELVCNCAHSGFAEEDCLAIYQNNGAITAALTQSIPGQDQGDAFGPRARASHEAPSGLRHSASPAIARKEEEK